MRRSIVVSDRSVPRGTWTCVTHAFVALALNCAPASDDPPSLPANASGVSVVEVRSYNLVPGSRTEFHRLVVDEAMPLLERWNVDVVAYGPSPHDDVSYYLMRRFESVEARERSEDAFYGSEEWRAGPRQAILDLIESYTTVVLPLDATTIQALRQDLKQ